VARTDRKREDLEHVRSGVGAPLSLGLAGEQRQDIEREARVHRPDCARWTTPATATSGTPRCGGCRFWIALTGVLGDDYGACTNPDSVRDGVVQFEHDGCGAFAPVTEGEWGAAPLDGP
jgi:hypothetical protein